MAKMKRPQYDHLGNAYLINDRDMKEFDRLCNAMSEGDDDARAEFVDKFGRFVYMYKEDQLLEDE